MRESARLGRNFAAVATAQFVAQLLTFVLSATIAITLGPSTYGLFVFGFAFPSLLLLLLSAGLDEVIAIDVAAKPSRAGSYLTTVALLCLPLAAISAAALCISLSFLLDVPFALSAVISTVIPSIGPVLLTISHGPLATGLFNAGLTLLMMVFSILTLCHVVLLPTLARIRASSPERLASILQHTQRFVFALGLPAALGAALYAEEIVTLFFGGGFRGAGEPFRVLMAAVAISSACIGNGSALAVSARQSQNLYVGSAGAATLVALSFVLIPGYGPLGAAVAFIAG